MSVKLSFCLIVVALLMTGCDVIKSFTGQAPTALPDLAISSVAYGIDPPGCITSKSKTTIVVWVVNKGRGAAGPFTVSVDHLTQTVSQGLAPGDYVSVTFIYSTAFPTVTIDKENAVAESDETNNIQEHIPIPVPTTPMCTPTS